MSNILVISQYFYPEQFRINDICKEWVKKGHNVTVLTGIPNYPKGSFYDGYGFSKKREENWEGIHIIRIPLIPRGKSSIGMFLNYLSFPFSGFFWNKRTKIKADLVFMFETSPMTQCLIGVRYKKKHKTPLFLYAQDLWPQNVEVITGIHSPMVIKPLQRMTDKIYRACDEIFVTSPSFVDEVVKRDIPESCVHYWPQYAESFYQPVEGIQSENDAVFKVIFTGNIGYAQGLDILPKTAKILKQRGITNVLFVIVGDGRYKDKLIEEVKEESSMFSLLPRRPAESIPEILGECDAAFLSFQDNELWKMTIPAKLQSYMACGIPVLASAEGETERIIKEAECGMSTTLGDGEALADAIVSMMNVPKEQRHKMGMNGKAYADKQFNQQMLMKEMEDYIAHSVAEKETKS